MTLAHYRCMKCSYEWHANPGPVECPKCRHLYVLWVNYESRKW
jgi:DNA-directed RNA polymerase subunit RPC12/RpoP